MTGRPTDSGLTPIQEAKLIARVVYSALSKGENRMQRTADDLRQRARELRKAGWRYKKIAATTGLSLMTVRRLCRKIKRPRTELHLRLIPVEPQKCCRCGERVISLEAVTRLCVECFVGNEMRLGRLQRVESAG